MTEKGRHGRRGCKQKVHVTYMDWEDQGLSTSTARRTRKENATEEWNQEGHDMSMGIFQNMFNTSACQLRCHMV